MICCSYSQKTHSISNRFFQCFSYIIDRVHQNSPTMYFRRANTDSGGPIRIQEGQYGFRRSNTDSGGPIRNRLWILGRPIRNRLCILGGLAGLRPREIPRSSPASPRKTPSFPHLLLRLTQSIKKDNFRQDGTASRLIVLNV